MTDTANTTPEASTEDRLAAYFTGDTKPEPTQEAPEVEATEDTAEVGLLEEQDDEPQVEEALPDADGLDLTYNGEELKVSREEAKNLAQLGMHVQKAQEKVVGELTQAQNHAREIAKAAEELSKTPGEVIGLRARLHALEFMSMNDPLGQLTPQNILAVAQQDPARAAEMQAKFQFLAAQYNATQAELSAAENRAKEQTKMLTARAVEAERAALHKILPQVRDPAKFEQIKQAVMKMGLRPQTLETIDSNAEVFAAFAKAAEYDRISAGKKQAVATAQKAPPVAKPGTATSATATNQDRVKKAREQLRRSGSVEDAARLLRMMR